MEKKLSLLGLLMISPCAWSLPFSITPIGALPATVGQGQTVAAAYNVKNNTLIQRNANYVKYLPRNVTVANGGCGSVFNLAPGESCTLNLTISGTVNAYDPNPHRHLFVCFPGGLTCAGPTEPLNVTVVPAQ